MTREETENILATLQKIHADLNQEEPAMSSCCPNEPPASLTPLKDLHDEIAQ